MQKVGSAMPDDRHNPQPSSAPALSEQSLADLLQRFLRAPISTARTLHAILTAAPGAALPSPPAAGTAADSIADPAAAPPPSPPAGAVVTRAQGQLLLYGLAILLCLLGNALLRSPGLSEPPAGGVALLGSGFCIWLLAELLGSGQSLKAQWQRLDRLAKAGRLARLLPLLIWLGAAAALLAAMSAPPAAVLGLLQSAGGSLALGGLLWVAIALISAWLRRRAPHITALAAWVQPPPAASAAPEPRARWGGISSSRLAIFALAAAASLLVWLNSGGNSITLPGILLWLLSAGLWAYAFAPLDWGAGEWAAGRLDPLRRLPAQCRQHRWALLAFALIMLLGISFRLTLLDSLPAEMTSDHVEKVLDAHRVSQGEYRIFFANNGGREPIQMYLLALLAPLPGLGFDHFTLKLLAVIESLLTLPILLWMGMELMGREDRRFGILVGLLLAGLVAVSHWHTAITRLGLRIVLTPLFTALLLIYLARAMRCNRRADYIKAGLVLGFGLYGYQAVRMLPLVVIAGIGIALAVRQISWRERLTYGVNLAVLVLVALMVFLPLFRFQLEEPQHFWQRTATRLLGDSTLSGTADGLDALGETTAIFMSNLRDALRMFHWEGDLSWFHNVPNEPALDLYTGTFLILGLAALAARLLQSRDPLLWLLPPMILIMLLPSALSIGFPIENPSHTRTSGVIPVVYLIAALPLALIGAQLAAALPRRIGSGAAVLFCSAVLLFANVFNTRLYFDIYPAIYTRSTYAYSEAGAMLRGFAESDGAYGNGFMLIYPHFWDHRAVGINAGQPLWPNSVFLQDLPATLDRARQRSDSFALNPDRDLLFFHSTQDSAATQQLREWFPEGREQLQQSHHPQGAYMLYRVPFLGAGDLDEFIRRHS